MKSNIIQFILAVMMVFCLAACKTKTVTETVRVPVNPDVTGKAIVEEEEGPLGKWIKCRVCDGKGRCQACNGKGKTNNKKCAACDGTGRCSVCDGEGGHREQTN